MLAWIANLWMVGPYRRELTEQIRTSESLTKQSVHTVEESVSISDVFIDIFSTTYPKASYADIEVIGADNASISPISVIYGEITLSGLI